MKGKNKYIIGIKTIILILILILSVLLPNLLLRNPLKTYATSFSNSTNTTLGTVTVKTDSSKIRKGDIVPIEIYLGGKDITQFVADLEYDMDLFDEIDIQHDIETNIKKWSIYYNGFSDAGYPIVYLNTSDSQYACTNDKLATIYLRAIENIEQDTYFTLRDIFIVNSNFDDNEEGNNEYPDLTLTIEGYLENNEENPDPGKDPDDGDDENTDPSGNEGENPVIPAKEYNITYNSNSVEQISNIPEKGTKTEKENYIISGIEPSKTGYTFEGWNTAIDGTGTTYSSGSIYNIDADLILYAQWKEVPKLQSLYLRSNTYKIGNTDITKYVEGDKYISRVTKETTLADYISELDTNGETIQVIKHDGQVLTDAEYVGTGMTLVVTKGEESIRLQIVVMGDLDGNGKVTATDLSTLNQTILQVIALENEYRIAGDLDENNNITITDLSTINQMVLRVL